ncbi:MAG: hypothetical protein KF858_08805 [Candidatus Sumerlaeia bacterium]|nr:hypothetical protein [Candidatus Sumerlaeia bacterium]
MKNHKPTTSLPRCCWAILVLALATACAGPMKPTGYLDDYGSFNRFKTDTFGMRVREGEDRSVDQYFLNKVQIEELRSTGQEPPSLEAAGFDPENLQPVLFIVNPPEWRAEWRPETDEELEGVLFTVRERFYRYLLRQYPHPVRVRYAYVPGDPLLAGYRVLELDSAVTDVNPGSGFLRYVIGYSAGAVCAQLEGRVREGNEVLAEFVAREEHAGYPNGFMNWQVTKTSYCLKYATEESIDMVTEHIRATIPAARLRPETVLSAGQ